MCWTKQPVILETIVVTYKHIKVQRKTFVFVTAQLLRMVWSESWDVDWKSLSTRNQTPQSGSCMPYNFAIVESITDKITFCTCSDNASRLLPDRAHIVNMMLSAFLLSLSITILLWRSDENLIRFSIYLWVPSALIDQSGRDSWMGSIGILEGLVPQFLLPLHLAQFHAADLARDRLG